MEENTETEEMCSEFEHDAENENDCVKDAVYWGVMVGQCEDFLNEIDSHMDNADTFAKFMKSNDPEYLREIFDHVTEMRDEGVSDELSNSTFEFVKRANNLSELRELLRWEWNPCTPALTNLTVEYKRKCEKIMKKITNRVEEKFPDNF